MAKNSFFSRLGRDLVSDENRNFRVKLGYTMASSLFGLICGVIISSIIWMIAFKYMAASVQIICGA